MTAVEGRSKATKLQAPEEAVGASHAEVGSPSFSDQELLDLVDAQHVMKLLSEGARKGLSHP